MGKFIFGSYIYDYSLIRQDRKTLSLTVTPDLRIIVKAPPKADPERIEAFLKRKWFWLEKQLSFFRQYQRKIYQREYISGESFWYLGRQYELLVKRAGKNSVLLTKGKLLVYTKNSVTEAAHNRKLIKSWFQDKTAKIFSERLGIIGTKFGYKIIPKMIVREMQKRWGSFLSKDKIILNPKLISVSKDCIDYVIAHELCHLKYKKHNTQFFNLLENKFAGWEKIKDKLEKYPI